MVQFSSTLPSNMNTNYTNCKPIEIIIIPTPESTPEINFHLQLISAQFSQCIDQEVSGI